MKRKLFLVGVALVLGAVVARRGFRTGKTRGIGQATPGGNDLAG